MTNIGHKLGWRQAGIFAGLTVGMAVLIIAVLVPPSNLPRRNTSVIYDLLLRARRVNSGATGVPTVALPNSVVLAPEFHHVVAGYDLLLHLRGETFAIEARPVQPGKTGVLYFYRDGDGVVRFDGYKPAGESSQPYVP
jgi:hypothetical protein